MKVSKLAAVLALLLVARAKLYGASKKRMGRAVLVPRILSLEHCQDGRAHALVVHNYSTLVDGRGVVFVTAFMEFLRSAKRLNSMKIVLHRCREAVSSNTCEYFATWPFTGNLCRFTTAKGMMWSGFLQAFRPSLKCPTAAAIVYKVENATFDLSLGEALANINIAGAVWDVEVTLSDARLFSCLKTAILINRVTIRE